MVKSSVFGLDFISQKTEMERPLGLCYKLHMMGITTAGPTYMYGENMSVIYNTPQTESTLKK